MRKRQAIEQAGAAMAFALAMTVFGCSTSQNQSRPDAGDDVGDVGLDGSNDGIATGQPVWTSGGRHISMMCIAFASGVMGFDADRAQLTDQQLALLDAMRTGKHDTPIEDGLGCTVAITGADGQIANYLVVQQDGALNDNTPLIAYATFQPFLAAVPCRYSADDGSQNPIAPDARCSNGIFLRPSPGNADRFLTITDPAPQRHIELDQCDYPAFAEALHLEVLATGGDDGGTASVLAQGSTPPAPTSVKTCQILDVTFPAAGTYVMRVVIDAGISPSSASNSAFRFF